MKTNYQGRVRLHDVNPPGLIFSERTECNVIYCVLVFAALYFGTHIVLWVVK